ncbi:MAG: alpha-L-rhamnosidase N-terminal domain-containing protein, partial [Tepidisphaeraceae bacterium]
MKSQIIALCCVLGIMATQNLAAFADVSPDHLRCDNRVNPLGIDSIPPRFSWIINSDQIGQRQTAYQILVASSQQALDQNTGNLWDTGKVLSDDSVEIPYAGAPLSSGQRCYWKVRVWDKDSNPSAYSATALWSVGLLHTDDWTAQWIGQDTFAPEVASLAASKWIWYPEGDSGVNAPAGTSYFRRTLEIPAGQTILAASCQITADNQFTLFVNGKQAAQGSNVYATVVVDIGGMLHAGANILAISATNDGKSPSNKAPKPAGLIAAIHVNFTHGPEINLITDDQWRTSHTAPADWQQVTFDDSKWKPVKIVGPFGITPWVGLNSEDGPILPARMLRKEFAIAKPIARATAYVCGLGLFEMYLNGKKVGDHVLDPALTDYDKRVLYETFDVTDQLRQGPNAVGVILGNGRFFTPRPKSAIGYGQPRLLLQMNIEYADGSVDHIVSDPTWKLTTSGPIRANNEYDGEEYNAQMEMPGWSESNFDDSSWT